MTRDEFVQTVTDTMLCTPHGNDPRLLVVEYDRLTADNKRLLEYIDGERSRHLELVVDLGEQVTKLTAERDAARDEIERLSTTLKSLEDTHAETVAYVRNETQQFNEGYEAFGRGESNDNAPHYDYDYDQWLVGWVWAQYVHVEAANRDDDDLDQYDSLIPEGK